MTTALPLPLLDVTQVEVIGDHRLLLTFEDGTVGEVAFGVHAWRGVFEPLADPDMAPEPLYEEARSHPAPAPPAVE